MADPLYRDLSDWTRKVVDEYPLPEVSDSYIHGTPLDECGDTLFTFIVRELEDAGDSDEASRMLKNASDQLQNLRGKL